VGDTQFVMAMYHTPAGMHPDDAAVQVLSGVLGDVPSGRLYKALVDNKKAVGAGMDPEERHDAGFVLASAQLSPDQNLEEAKQILLKTVEDFAKEPPSKEEVERVKTRIAKNIELAFANSQAIALDLADYAGGGRLAHAVPGARPPESDDAGGRGARGQGLLEGIQPHAGRVHSHQDAGSRRDSRHTDRCGDVQGFQRRRAVAEGEVSTRRRAISRAA
jgi:hypothetical protein